MSRRRRLFVSLVVVALVGAAGALVLWPSGQSDVASVHGDSSTLVPMAKRKPLPNLSGAALTPPPQMIALQAAIRPEVIDVWASWCIPCKEEAPIIGSLHNTYRRQIRFLGIDVEDSRGAARAFERRYGIRFPSIFDRSASMAGKLGFVGLPTALLVDANGRIAARLIGKQTRAALELRIRRLISERAG
jgi:cytochrome c biogenesis protein CcmG/thiol:disulfide interchange protein DsbE